MIAENGIDQIRQAILDGQTPDSIIPKVDSLTLGAAIELCCARWCWQRNQVENGIALFRELTSRFESLRDIDSALRNGRTSHRRGRESFTPEPNAMCTVRSENDITGVDFPLFLKRFAGALEASYFGKELSQAIAAALGEMADNVVQHAGLSDGPHGIVAYETSSRTMSFFVADVGQGIHRSLTRSNNWKHLSDMLTKKPSLLQYAKMLRPAPMQLKVQGLGKFTGRWLHTAEFYGSGRVIPC